MVLRAALAAAHLPQVAQHERAVRRLVRREADPLHGERHAPRRGYVRSSPPLLSCPPPPPVLLT